MIRTPYVALKRAQRKLPGSKIVIDPDYTVRLQLADGTKLSVDDAAKQAGINYVPYIWRETHPGGATYHE